MKIPRVLRIPDMSPFWYWINERHKIYRYKEDKRPQPWTADPILQKYRFCNVFRELDKVTIWIRKNWREPYADHPNLWFAMCLARQINLPGTLEEIGFPVRWSPERVRKIMKARQKRGDSVYTGAYIITAGGRSGSKIDYTIDHVMNNIWEKRDMFLKNWHAGPPSLQHCWNVLTAYHGFGPFMSYEVISDLRHTRYLENAMDIMTWANAGPGAKRGLNRLWGRPLKAPLTQETACEMMQTLLNISGRNCRPFVPNLEMRDIEHSLCETDKYLRVKTGQGRPRSLYKAAQA